MRPRAIAILTVCVAMVCGSTAIAARTREPIAPSAGTTTGQAEIRDLVARINRHRRATGRPTVVWDDRLAQVAQRHGEDMARRGYFGHENPDGLDPFDRIEKAGIRFQAAAENLASGQRTGAETFEAWMHSRGHRENLEGRDYTRIGIGLYRGRWTCLLMRPRRAR